MTQPCSDNKFQRKKPNKTILLNFQPVRFTAIQLAIAFRRRETASILLQAGCKTDNLQEFLQLRLPYVTPDRTRSMLRCTQKVLVTIFVGLRYIN